jgi:hypothetical protein
LGSQAQLLTHYFWPMSKVNLVPMQPEITRPSFIRLLAERFPAIASDVLDEDYAGLLHLQVSFLADYANDCLAAGRLDELRRVVDFFQEMVTKKDGEVENALYVSFLEHVEMAGDSKNCRLARSFFTPTHLEAWVALRKWLGLATSPLPRP